MAIAFGGVSAVSTSSTPTSVTVSGSNTLGLLFISDGNTGSDEVTAVTWGGVSMTKIGSSVQVPSDRWMSAWYIINPSSAASISITGGSSWRSFSSYYTGVDQSSPLDSSATNTASATNTISISTTVVASNCWVVAFIKDSTGSKTYTPTNAVQLMRADGDAGGIAIADSNGTVGTGSQTATLTSSGTLNIGGIAFSIAPYVAPTGGYMTLNPYWGA